MNETLGADGELCPVCFNGRLNRGIKRITTEYKGRIYQEDQPGDWCDVCNEGILNGNDLEATETAWLAFRDRIDKQGSAAILEIGKPTLEFR